MRNKQWMIYGANGYSGELIAKRAFKTGLKPILAGRNRETISKLAMELDLPWRCFDLDTPETICGNLEDVDCVVHCAGPFSATSKPMLEACLETSTHYFDITGEIDVFEFAHSEEVSRKAKDAGIIVCPGIGFDVIPTDCIALKLSQAMPDAIQLNLGFSSRSPMSPGTAKTMVEGLAKGIRTRVYGKIVSTSQRLREVDYGKGPKRSMLLSWGDVSTAYYSTGIPNIAVYIPASKSAVRFIKIATLLKPIFKMGWVQNLLKQRAGKQQGPDSDIRDSSRTLVWGEVWDKEGNLKTVRIQTVNGYELTVDGPLAIIDHFLERGFSKTGSLTPAMLMGADFIAQLPGTEPSGALVVESDKST